MNMLSSMLKDAVLKWEPPALLIRLLAWHDYLFIHKQDPLCNRLDDYKG